MRIVIVLLIITITVMLWAVEITTTTTPLWRLAASLKALPPTREEEY